MVSQFQQARRDSARTRALERIAASLEHIELQMEYARIRHGAEALGVETDTHIAPIAAIGEILFKRRERLMPDE